MLSNLGLECDRVRLLAVEEDDNVIKSSNVAEEIRRCRMLREKVFRFEGVRSRKHREDGLESFSETMSVDISPSQVHQFVAIVETMLELCIRSRV